MTPPRKKLIEVALPLDAINVASAKEKSIRHGHPSTLHLWWARRPLAAARAVIFAQMVDDPSACQEEFPTEADQNEERERLFDIIKELVIWKNTTNEAVLERARAEIRKSWRRTCAENADHPRASELFNPDKLPAFHDPFAGGGSLPLEAQRLGLEAHASDLNPVAVLINKAMIEIPPKFAGRPPVNPEARAKYLDARTSRTNEPLLGARASRPHKAWHSRGYLPHLDQPDIIQSITFRLADSVPADVIAAWKSELALKGREATSDPRCAELRERIERYAGQGHGACWLRDERIAGQVEDALLHFDGVRYRLLSWVIMPNHVHALIETTPGFPLEAVVHSWKSFTAKQVNKILGRSGQVWEEDYFDRYIRDENHLSTVVDYIEQNPVKAGLVDTASDWRWSSASRNGSNTKIGGATKENADGTELDGVRKRHADETSALPGLWTGAKGLAEDVRYYGKWMRDEAEKRIGHLYPKIEVTPEMVRERPDLKQYEGRKLTVIAWLWARTVKSPNPAFTDIDVPLVSNFMLSTKKGKEAYVDPVIEARSYRFAVRVGSPMDPEAAKRGTTVGKRQAFRCLMSGVPVPYDHIRNEGKVGRMGARLMAIVAEGAKGRVYLSPTIEHEIIARKANPEWKPEVALPNNPRDFKTPNYGLPTFADLFTDRQLVALTTLSDLVTEAMEPVKRDYVRTRTPDKQAGGASTLPDNYTPLQEGGNGATAYAQTVGVYLAFAVDRVAMSGNSLVRWNAVGQKAQHCFGRQALPMLWDFAEPNFLASATGSIDAAVFYSSDPLNWLESRITGSVHLKDAVSQEYSKDKLVSTDPPYYDNVGYADLSDFFYVWLRRSLKSSFPDLFATLAVPKAEELVATPYRHGTKAKAEEFFLNGMKDAMQRIAENSHFAFPTTIYYAFKQSEIKDSIAATVRTGWESFLEALIQAGLSISGTWPIRTEMRTRQVGMNTNALASSIVLSCRKRVARAPLATRREFVAALREELPGALARLQSGNIAPVDLAQAAIGPGMAVFTRYAKVLDAQGDRVSVREALSLINQTLDEVLAEREGEFDADTRWALAWFEQEGFGEGEYGVAETLSKAKNTSIAGIVDGGILASRGGKVRLLRPKELASDWNPTTDARLTVWEAVHYLVHALESGGESTAATLVRQLGGLAETARELAYRLYTVCERKNRADEARSYNGLVQSWPEIARLSRERAPEAQGDMFRGGDPRSVA